jgi:hypothetical protein
MARGKSPAIYASDSAEEFGTQVDDDHMAEVSRGWTPMPPGANRRRFPKGFKPRHVQGIDATGFRGSAVIGSNAAALWTGADTTFTVEGSDMLPHVMTVTNKVGETGGSVGAPPAP